MAMGYKYVHVHVHVSIASILLCTHVRTYYTYAAFIVSAYVTVHHRPARELFNPILGETYEWIREDNSLASPPLCEGAGPPDQGDTGFGLWQSR